MRTDIKAAVREKMSEPYKSLVEMTRPMENEIGKEGQGRDAGKTNKKWDRASEIAGKAGTALIVAGLSKSAAIIVNSDDPYRQTAIEGGSWSGAIVGGRLGSAAGAEIGGFWGALGGGLTGAFYGGMYGEEAVRGFTEPAKPSAIDRIKSAAQKAKVSEAASEQKQDIH